MGAVQEALGHPGPQQEYSCSDVALAEHAAKLRQDQINWTLAWGNYWEVRIQSIGALMDATGRWANGLINMHLFDSDCTLIRWGFPSGAMVKNLPGNVEVQNMHVWSLGWEDPLEKEMATHSSTLPWRIPWKKSLVGYCPWDHKESDITEQLSMHAHTYIR